MKRTKVTYWVFTGLAAFMLMASIPDVLRLPEAVAFFTHLGYPTFMGTKSGGQKWVHK